MVNIEYIEQNLKVWVNNVVIYDSSVNTSFEFTKMVYVGGDWTTEVNMFNGIIYFADVTHLILTEEQIHEIFIRETKKITKVSTKVIIGDHLFVGMVTDGRRCVKPCDKSVLLPDSPNGPTPPAAALI